MLFVRMWIHRRINKWSRMQWLNFIMELAAKHFCNRPLLFSLDAWPAHMIHGPVCMVRIYGSSCLYIQSYIFLHGQNDYTNIYHVLLYHLILQKLEMWRTCLVLLYTLKQVLDRGLEVQPSALLGNYGRLTDRTTNRTIGRPTNKRTGGIRCWLK